MATLTEIVNGKGSKKEAKQIAKLIEAIAVARADYGNEKEVIASPVISGTCEGAVKFSNLPASDKLALVNRQIACIRKEVGEVEFFLENKVNAKTLTKVLKEVQAAAIATNPVLVNLGSTANSKYL